MKEILIGIDDTDNPTSPGTGRLARILCAELIDRGMKSLGVTRHQFLIDKAIPYTSHNSGACIGLVGDDGIEAVKFAFDFVTRHAAQGSDPGVCIAGADAVDSGIVEFANSATKKVLKIDEAYTLAKSTSISLRGLGGSCQGVIGALASVGLRAEGNKGRFIDLPGLRNLPHNVNAHAYHKMGITIQYKSCRRPRLTDRYDTLGWVRPRLINGKPVLIVEWSERNDTWIPVDKKPSDAGFRSNPPSAGQSVQ